MSLRHASLLLAACALTPGVTRAAEAAPAPTASALDPAALDKARKLVELVLPPEKRDQIFEGAVNAMMQNMVGGLMQGQAGFGKAIEEEPELKTVFAAFVERQRSLSLADIRETMPELMTAYANAYARMFSSAELDQITAFVATPTGTKYVQRSTEILSDPDFAAWQRNVSARSQARLSGELSTLMKNVMAIKTAKGATHHGS